MKCKICGVDYYWQTDTDPGEDCWCGEMATELEGIKDRIKWLRFHIAGVLLKVTEYVVDKLTQREV